MYIGIGVIAVIGIILQGIFITVEHKERYVAADIFKGLAAACFVYIGFIGFVMNGTAFATKIAIGLLFGMLGDIIMNLRFVLKGQSGQKAFLAGIFAFLIGHIMYVTALVPESPHLVLCVIIGAVLAGGLLTYIFKTMQVKKAFKIFGVFYLGAVIIMTVLALDLAIMMPTNQHVMYAIGAVLFTASDIVLIFNTFSGVTLFPLRITNLSLYYIGQLLIAGSLLI